MTRRPIQIFETASRRLIDAELMIGLTPAQVITAETEWRPHRQTTPETEHSHWDWSLKTGLMMRPGTVCLGIEFNNQMQGMLMLDEGVHTARLPPDEGQPLVFVHFLESAPWNVRQINAVQRFRLVGGQLMRAAVEYSLEVGYSGRLALTSLPQSESFYEDACGMTAAGRDEEYNALAYYEFTADDAVQFNPGG